MADLVFIQPKTGIDVKGVTIVMPMGALHAISLVEKEGSSVCLIDQRVDNEWRTILKKELDKKPVCIGITTMTGKQIHYSLEIAKFVKEINPKIPIVWGGVHPSLLPRQTLENKYVDIVIIGEGEITIVELLESLKNKKDLGKVKGIGYKKNGKIIINEARLFEDLNKLPDVPYHLIDVNNYFIQQYESPKMLSFLSGKGCPHRCAYCYNQIFNKRKWRGLDPDEILIRLKRLLKYKPETLEFVDDDFFVNKERVRKICELIIRENINIKIVSNCRIDYIANYDLDFLRLLKRAGFSEFYVGVESGSERTLKLIKKDITVDQILNANKKLRETGINPIYSFIGGFPGETFDDIKKTIGLMIKIIKDNPDASLTSIKVFTPYPGTELFDVCVKNGFNYPKTLEGWANFDYSTSIYNWGSKKDMKLLKKLTYMTYFLDQKTISNQLAKDKPLLKFLMIIYSKIVNLRCKHNFYAFTPEVKVMEIFKRKVIN